MSIAQTRIWKKEWCSIHANVFSPYRRVVRSDTNVANSAEEAATRLVEVSAAVPHPGSAEYASPRPTPVPTAARASPTPVYEIGSSRSSPNIRHHGNNNNNRRADTPTPSPLLSPPPPVRGPFFFSTIPLLSMDYAVTRPFFYTKLKDENREDERRLRFQYHERQI